MIAKLDHSIEARSDQLMRQDLRAIYQHTDRMFACLMVLQWFACVAAALWISPHTWTGAWSTTHVHVWAAIFLGGAISSLPILLASLRPGELLTRHVIAVAQMLTSALLIHLMGGRIEAHFHVFGSLALLAAYRDWRVLLTSTIVVALDHGIRGAVWPESVYGVLTAAPWRTLEHAGWVVFEDTFLIVIIRQSIKEMRSIANQRAMLESTNRTTEETVRHRTAELQRAKDGMRLIIDSAPNGLVMIDETGSITMVNPKVEAMFGYTSEELLGQKIEILVPERLRQQHPELRRSFMKQPTPRPMGEGRDLYGVRKDGQEFPVELGLNPLLTDEGLFVLAAVIDITERKKVDLELQEYTTQLQQANRDLTKAQAELQQKNQELDEFTYVASHDLQEPVRKLISFSELLKQDAGDALNDHAQKDLGFIVDAASRMRQLVQDLLALSRAGRSATKAEEVYLNECRQYAIDALHVRIEETNADLTSDDLPRVIGDRTMLTQLFQNLIGNALKFVADRKPEISITVESDGDHWILGVRDNGIGIKQEYADRIFKPFQRLHRRDQYEGTGIGLSICRKTVERHGGRLWFESTVGAGTHFKFTLPKLPEEERCKTVNETPDERLLSC